MKNLNRRIINSSPCRRCGTCCKKNSPSLHGIDSELIQSGAIPRNQLITYRKGEWINDNVAGQFIRLEQDIIKPIENKKDGYCTFYIVEDRSCGIYAHRPVECQTQNCYDPEPFIQMYAKNRLTRRDIFPSNSAYYEMIEYHESRCPLSELENIRPFSNMIVSEQAISTFKEMIRFEFHFRYTLHKRTGLQSSEMNFLLGRSVETILNHMQVKL
ncbi:MAG: YkgJ family cysteine cluster protein [Candidatus Magnetomorum sp.]|nr:YkgJ family cysteine cluster protein [Candidatus Magnetomorum sp.]